MVEEIPTINLKFTKRTNHQIIIIAKSWCMSCRTTIPLYVQLGLIN